MRAGAAFTAGLVLGVAAGWLAVSRGLGRAPAAPSPSSAPAGVVASACPAQPAAPAATPVSPAAAFPALSSPPPLLGVPAVAAPAGPASVAPAPFVPPGAPEAPLGTRSPSPVPGDSTDAQLTPQALAPPAAMPALPSVTDLDRLRGRTLLLPVQGFDLHQLRDDFAEKRGAHVHEAIDMPAPRGTPVLAADDGTVKKLFTSGAGGLTVYEFDPSGTYCYYYAHLDHYAEGLHEGQVVRRGERLGYVGTSGNAPPDTPHLHFTVFKLPPSKHWWEGTPINPYPLWALQR